MTQQELEALCAVADEAYDREGRHSNGMLAAALAVARAAFVAGYDAGCGGERCGLTTQDAVESYIAVRRR